MPNFNRLIEIGYALTERYIPTGRCNHISILLNKNKILSIANNDYTKSSSSLSFYGYQDHDRLHSEFRAIMKLGVQNCKGFTLFNMRIDKNGKLAESCPCVGCSNVIKTAKIKTVYYTDKSGNIVKWN